MGDTPLVKLTSLSVHGRPCFAKLEGHNPFGSVKDRAAFWMIKDLGLTGKQKDHRRTGTADVPHAGRAYCKHQ